MTLTKGLILAGIWYLAVLTTAWIWFRRRPPTPQANPDMSATDWVAAMPTQPDTPAHGTPMERCRFRWQTPNTFSDPGTEADDTHRCALFTIHTDHHICPCGARTSVDVDNTARRTR